MGRLHDGRDGPLKCFFFRKRCPAWHPSCGTVLPKPPRQKYDNWEWLQLAFKLLGKGPVMVWKRHCRAPFQKAVRQHSESIRPLLAMCVTARPRWEKSADHLALSHQKRCRIDVKPIKMVVVIQRNVDQCYLVSSKIIPTKTGWWLQYVSTLCGGDPYVEWWFPIEYKHEVVCLDGHKLMYGAYIFIQLLTPKHHFTVPLMTLPELGKK